MSPEGQHVVAFMAPASGYETLEGRLSVVAAQGIAATSGSGAPLAVLAVARPVGREILEGVGSYAGVA